MTIKNLEKSVNNLNRTLTPRQKASYASVEEWKMAEEASNGKSIDARQRDLERFIQAHVFTLKPREYIEFLAATDDYDIAQWAERYFTLYIAGLSREDEMMDTIITLNRMIQRLVTKNKDSKNSDDDAYNHYNENIALLQQRRTHVRHEIKSILTEVPWEKWGLHAPPEQNP
jgi:hypothetical protein